MFIISYNNFNDKVALRFYIFYSNANFIKFENSTNFSI